jgi:hypothetical protein
MEQPNEAFSVRFVARSRGPDLSLLQGIWVVGVGFSVAQGLDLPTHPVSRQGALVPRLLAVAHAATM